MSNKKNTTSTPVTPAKEINASIALNLNDNAIPEPVVSPAMLKVMQHAEKLVNTPSKGKKSKTPKACLCGCGRMTKGGQWFPGDDARFKGRYMDGLKAGLSQEDAQAQAIRKGKESTEQKAAA